MRFEYVFNDPWFFRMRTVQFGPEYGRVRAWRSTDPGQTYRVVIAEDTVRECTTVIMNRKDGEQLTSKEKTMILDEFYPARYGYREDGTGSSHLARFSVWPHPDDHELLWYSKQLEAYHGK